MVQEFGSHFSFIHDLDSYFNECMRLLTRPDLTLELRLFARDSERLNVFTSHSASIAKHKPFNAKLNRNVLIDSGCRIGDNCELENCWLGRNCHLGSNVKLINSIMCGNCKIGPDSCLNACILGFNVRLGSNVCVCQNCVLADGTHVVFIIF